MTANARDTARTTRANKRSQRKQKLLPYIADSILLEEAGMPWLVRTSIIAASLIVFAFIGWSATTRSAEVSVAPGWIKPSGNVQAVQHLEGGIVAEILVEEGAIVEQGQLLVKLQEASVGSDLAVVTGRHVQLQLQAERLRAFVDGVQPDFGGIAVDDPQSIADQQQILAGDIAARDANRRVHEEQIKAQQSQLTGLDQRAQTARKQISLLQSELDARGSLAEKGLTSRFQLLRVEQEMNRAQGELAQVAAEREQVVRSIAEIRERINEAEASSQARALAELGRVTDELLNIRDTIAKHNDRFERLNLRAPVRGIVQAMEVHTVGGVVEPGRTIVEIVPVNDALVAEVRLSPRDIGHITPGLSAKVKLATYDFSRFGAADGTLQSVSATTFFDDQGQPYYKGIVHLAQNFLGENPQRNPITPGMTLSAEILTQDRSLLTYLMRPVYRGISEGFRER